MMVERVCWIGVRSSLDGYSTEYGSESHNDRGRRGIGMGVKRIYEEEI
jgi:hypothetical protein